jgi:ABC-2 type transport system ATP-binding protein
VSVDGVSRSFGQREVLIGVDLDADPGSLTVVTGSNGSGKTSLLRVIGGLLAADSGLVTVCDAPAGRGKTGFLPAGDRGLHWRLTGRQNLTFFARLAALPDVTGRVEGAARAAGAVDLLDARVGECSTGQRRRLAVAQAIVGLPPVLLLDEPYADLDEPGVDRVNAIVATWCEQEGTVISAAPTALLAPSVPDPILLRLSGSEGA